MGYLELGQGEQVFEFGSQGDLFYFIVEGAVEISIQNYNRAKEYN